MTEPGPDTLLSRAAASEAVSDIGWRYLLGTLALSVPVRSLVDDSFARSFWVLADAEGNEACVCTWAGRDGPER
jgi:hypothetical protein